MKTSRITLGRTVLAVLAVPFVLVAVACSSAKSGVLVTEPAPNDPADSGAAVVAPAPDASGAAPPAPEPPKKDASVPDPPAGECAAATTQTACITCCSSKHEDGAGVYFVALIDCMCLPANCAKECALTLCDPENPKNADADCQTCVQAKNSACAPTIKSTCTADTDCVAFDGCIGQSDCAGK
jgi:hypothetical protein